LICKRFSKYQRIYDELFVEHLENKHQVSNATKLNSVFEDTCRVGCFGDCEHRADEHFRQWIKENNAEAQEKYLTVCYTQCAAICQQRLDPFRTTVGNCMAPSWCSENAFLVIFYVDSNQNGTATNSVGLF
jgi:hypothetical protein